MVCKTLNSNLNKSDDGQTRMTEQMSGVEFDSRSQTSRSDENADHSLLDYGSGYRLQHITDSLISLIESMTTFSGESFLHVIFEEIFAELERQAFFSLGFDEKNAGFDFIGKEIEVQTSYDTFLVVH